VDATPKRRKKPPFSVFRFQKYPDTCGRGLRDELILNHRLNIVDRSRQQKNDMCQVEFVSSCLDDLILILAEARHT
jgi:hypothetical protein